MKVSVNAVKRVVEEQSAWIRDTEFSLLLLLNKKISQRYAIESSTIERLIGMIGECIEQAEPIHNRWLLAPDVIAVTNALLVPFKSPPPVPFIEEYHPHQLNDNQYSTIAQSVNLISLGSIILEQDLLALLDRGLSPIGPYSAQTVISDRRLTHLTFPKDWRDLEKVEIKSEFQGDDNQTFNGNSEKMMKGIRKYFMSNEKVHGVDEKTGTIFMESTLDLLGNNLSKLLL